jgi:hypothetical protein
MIDTYLEEYRKWFYHHLTSDGFHNGSLYSLRKKIIRSNPELQEYLQRMEGQIRIEVYQEIVKNV